MDLRPTFGGLVFGSVLIMLLFPSPLNYQHLVLANFGTLIVMFILKSLGFFEGNRKVCDSKDEN